MSLSVLYVVLSSLLCLVFIVSRLYVLLFLCVIWSSIFVLLFAFFVCSVGSFSVLSYDRIVLITVNDLTAFGHCDSLLPPHVFSSFRSCYVCFPMIIYIFVSLLSLRLFSFSSLFSFVLSACVSGFPLTSSLSSYVYYLVLHSFPTLSSTAPLNSGVSSGISYALLSPA